MKTSYKYFDISNQNILDRKDTNIWQVLIKQYTIPALPLRITHPKVCEDTRGNRQPSQPLMNIGRGYLVVSTPVNSNPGDWDLTDLEVPPVGDSSCNYWEFGSFPLRSGVDSTPEDRELPKYNLEVSPACTSVGISSAKQPLSVRRLQQISYFDLHCVCLPLLISVFTVLPYLWSLVPHVAHSCSFTSGSY